MSETPLKIKWHKVLDNPANYKPDPEDFTKIVYEEQRIPRRIVAACNLYGDVRIIGIRHFCPLMGENLRARGMEGHIEHEQGFVDQYGIFVSRTDAKIIAQTNGQHLREAFISDEAYSENFW